MTKQSAIRGPWQPTFDRDLRYGSVDAGNTPPTIVEGLVDAVVLDGEDDMLLVEDTP